MPKNAIYLAKNAVKNQIFFPAEKLIILLIGNLRLLFSNAHAEAGMRDITAIQVYLWCVII